MNNKEQVKSLRNSFLEAYNEKDFFSAIELLKKIIKLYDDEHDEYDECEYLSDLYNLGILYGQIGKFSMSNKAYKKIIKILDNKEYDIEKDLKKIEILIDAENSIGVSYAKVGTNTFALASFEKALSLTRKYLKNDKKRLLDITHNMGCIYYELESFEDAIYYHLEELSLREDKDEDFIDNLNFLGYDYEEIENYEKSIGYLRQALDIIKGLEGINSYEYMNNTYYLASVYLKNKDYKNAIKYYEKSCNFIENKLGEKNPYLAEALTKLSAVYIKAGKIKEALNSQLKSLNIVKESVGKTHIYYASNVKKIADIHYLEKDYEKALQYYEEETAIKKVIIGTNNEEYVNSILNLINVKIKAFNEDYSNIEQEIYNLINIDFPVYSYKRALLILCKIYIENDKPNNLYTLYEFYQKIEPEESFDDMLENAKKIEEDIIHKEYDDFLKQNLDFEQDYNSIQDEIFDGIKNLFDGIKKQIDDYDSNKDNNDNQDLV